MRPVEVFTLDEVAEQFKCSRKTVERLRTEIDDLIGTAAAAGVTLTRTALAGEEADVRA